MSIDSHNRILADKYNKGGEFYDKLYESSERRQREEEDMINEYQEPSRSFRVAKIVITEIFIALFLLLAMKNPTPTQAKAEIKMMLLEKYNANLRRKLAYTDMIDKQIQTSFAEFIAPSIIDTWLQTDVSDYVFFSLFSTGLRTGRDERAVMSGVIIFGKIVPISYDVKKILH